MPHPQVLIVGAGPVGLTAALALQRSGVSFRIIEKLDAFRPDTLGAFSVLQPRSLEHFKSLGILHDILAISTDIPQIRFYAPGGEVVKTWDFIETNTESPAIPFRRARISRQVTLEAILRSHLAKLAVEIELSTEVISLTQTDDDVHVTLLKRLDDGSSVEESLEIEYLIGSDGSKGTTRKLANISSVMETRDDTASVFASVAIRGLDHTLLHIYGKPGDLVLVLPIDANPSSMRFTLIFSGKPSQMKELSQAAESDANEIRTAFHTFTEDNSLEMVSVDWVSYWRPSLRCVEKFRVGRVFLAGDSAHTHPPIGGQGLNTGVQDALNLSWKLALVLSAISSPILLETYEQERMPVVREMLQLANSLLDTTLQSGTGPGSAPPAPSAEPTRFVSSTSPRAASSITPSKPSSLSSMPPRPKIIHQLGVNYRWSPIVFNSGQSFSLHTQETYYPYGGERDEGKPAKAGDRAPDAPGLLLLSKDRAIIDRVEVNLFDLLEFTRHIALVFTSPSSMSRIEGVVQLLGKISSLKPEDSQSGGLVRTHIILPPLTPSLSSHRIELDEFPPIRAPVLIDTLSHASKAYTPDHLTDEGNRKANSPSLENQEDRTVIVLIRPDAYIGAILETNGEKGALEYGVKEYFRALGIIV